MKKVTKDDFILYMYDSFFTPRCFIDDDSQLKKHEDSNFTIINCPWNENIIEEKLEEALASIQINENKMMKDAILHESKIFDFVIDESQILEALKKYHLDKYYKIASEHDKRIFTFYDMESEISVVLRYFIKHLPTKINEAIEDLIKEAEFEMKNYRYSGFCENMILPAEVEKYIMLPAYEKIRKRLKVKQPGGSQSVVNDDDLDLILLRYDQYNAAIKKLKKIFFDKKQIDRQKYNKADARIKKILDIMLEHINENPGIITTRICSKMFNIYIDPQILYRKILKRKKYQQRKEQNYKERGLSTDKINKAFLESINCKPE